MTQSSDWTGSIGDTWASEWQRTDRSFVGLAPHLDAAILAAAPVGPFNAIDLGSGAGATSLALATARADASVLGIDLSDALVAVARSRGNEATNLRFAAGDALALATTAPPVDLYCSRHGVMFFDDPIAAFTTLADAAAPDGRLVFSCFAERTANLWAVETLKALGMESDAPTGIDPGPFAFADSEHVEGILSAAGWVADAPLRVTFEYVAGAGDDPVADAVAFFTRIGPAASILRAAADRNAAIAALTDACAARLDGNRVAFPAVAWGYGRPNDPQERHRHDDHRPPSRKFTLATHPVDARRTGAAV